MIKNITIICLLVLGTHAVIAQVDFKQTYLNGKNFFRDAKYNLAMETFKKVIPYDKNNPFSEYAMFYYAVSAYRQSYPSVAKDMFMQLKSLYPKWDKMDDVNYWLAKIHLDSKNYFQGFKLANSIQDKKIQQEVVSLKKQNIAKIQDVETLRMMSEEYPKDEIVGKALAKGLSKNLSNDEDKNLLELLIGRFNLKREEYILETPKTFYKDVYSVSLLFPFMIQSLEPTQVKKKNQMVLDLYEGMKLAIDTLKKLGVNISMRAYDTQRNAEKIKKLLVTDELKNTDLIVGPLFAEENKVVQDFSITNKINVINPISNNGENLSVNPYAFLFQPSFETLGKKAAEFMAGSPRKKNCMVFYGTSKRDSVLAANFIQSATALGIKVLASKKIPKDADGRILTLLATPTEFDEFNYPKEFSIKKDSIGCIFVASEDALIYSKVVSSVETRNDGIVVIGSENWLDKGDLELYERRGVVFYAPGYTRNSSRNYQIFFRRYINKHGVAPSDFAKTGYEFMLFIGLQLKKNGVYFQDGLSKQSFIQGFMSEGFNFQSTRDNQVVPFISFKDGELILAEKR